MNTDKKWMLMTYYCPTHGEIGRIESVDLTREEMSKKFKIGLFGINSNSGIAMTKVKNRWEAKWEDIKTVVEICDKVYLLNTKGLHKT